MEPSFHNGDFIIVNTLIKKFKRGDVIVLRSPQTKKPIVKRVYSVLSERYAVRGDNLPQSTDSRQFGSVDNSLIIGKVWKKIGF